MIEALDLLLDLRIRIRQLGGLAAVVVAASCHAGTLRQVDDEMVLAELSHYFGFGFVVASRA